MKSKISIISVAAIMAGLAVWFVLTRNLAPQDRLFYPSPIGVVSVFTRHIDILLLASAITLGRVLGGLVVGGIIGVIVALLMHASNIFARIIDPFIEIIRPVPPLALVPFFILWFGLGTVSQMSLIALGCFMMTVVAVYSAARNTPPIYIRAALSLGATWPSVYWNVILRYCLLSLAGSLRIASATAFAITVAAEYLGAQGGLGFIIRNSRTTLETDVILAAAICLGILSYGLDLLIRISMGWLTRWAPRFETN
jgi:taurine transport system permease protein